MPGGGGGATNVQSVQSTAVENVSETCPPASSSPIALPLDHPWVRLGYAGAILSTSPLVVQVHNFMSQAECDAVIAASNELQGSQGAQYAKPCKECRSWWMQNNDRRHREPSPLFDMLEERLGNLTGVADHAGEAAIKLTSYTKYIPTDEYIPPDAYVLHHEKVGRPRRIATVIVFLSSLQPDEGGHTVFPAAQLGSKRDDVRNAFAAITPPLGKYFQVNEHTVSGEDKVGLRSPEAAADPNVEKARAAAEAACRDAADGTPSAVASPAQAGSAVVWYHELGRNRKVDPMAWHAGCFVRGFGVTRWAIQKFKESQLTDERPLYLPKNVGSLQVLKALGNGRFKVLPESGVAFRLKKDLNARHRHLGLDQSQIVTGIDEDEWLKVGLIEPPATFYQVMK
eukprot:CAMPEP_0117555566 /NCGR_PEP_ID=MMETSP0784-20121206/51340_1 /TAXON_ID=39447 /ORGANISM="" /LENGTH=397 /DNA_ID=CAMNT_0005352775 /DNA_START=93 /DNA_END=1284 /DNA_ORIENTATION=+